MATEADEERRALLHLLQYQRDSVLAIVDGLSEEAWHTSVVPSGWTPAGLVEHLGAAERHWFQQVVNGSEDALPWDEGLPPYDPEGAFTIDRPSADVVAYYREQCARSDAVLAGVSMSDPPRRARRPRGGRGAQRALGRAAHDRGDRGPFRPPGDRPGDPGRPDRTGPALAG
jgi:Protein of unknown function (DUF664)